MRYGLPTQMSANPHQELIGAFEGGDKDLESSPTVDSSRESSGETGSGIQWRRIRT